MKFLEIDSKNIYTSLLYMANFIRTRKVINSEANNIPELKGFGKVAWNFIFSIYNSKWDSLSSDKYNNLFRTKVLSKFTLKSPKINLGPTLDILKSKVAEIIKLPSLIPACPPKKVLEKYKFFDKRNNTVTKAKKNIQQSYAQVANPKVSNILKLKENYLNLLANKIKNIHRIINNTDKTKSCIIMTTKSLSQKQIIVSMGQANVNKILTLSSIHVANINRALRNIKSNVMIDYI